MKTFSKDYYRKRKKDETRFMCIQKTVIKQKLKGIKVTKKWGAWMA